MSNSSDSTNQADDWRSKVFIDRAEYFNHPKYGIEHKLALLISLVAPNLESAEQAHAQQKYLKACTEAVEAYIAQAQQQLLRELIEQLPELWSREKTSSHTSDESIKVQNYTVGQVTALLNKKLQAYGGDV